MGYYEQDLVQREAQLGRSVMKSFWTTFFSLVSILCFGKVIEMQPGQDEVLRHVASQCEIGDTLRLLAGEHVLTQAFRPPSGIHVQGEGMGKTVLLYSGDEPSELMNLSGCDSVEVSHLTLDGRNDPRVSQGIVAHCARNLTLHHVAIRDLAPSDGFGPHGILFHGNNPGRDQAVTDSLIESCHLTNIGMGARFGCGIRLSWGSSRNRVENCIIEDTGRGGIFADNGSMDLLIRGNTVTGSGGEGLGIEVWGGCDRAVIEDNRIDHWLSFGGCDWGAARRNVISSNLGIYKFCGIEGIGSHLVITDNRVDGGQKIGLSVSSKEAKEFVYWRGNHVQGCNQWGAQFQGEEGGVACHYLLDCTFQDMPLDTGPVWYAGDEGYGFRINGNVRRVTFEACAFLGNGRAGMQIVGQNVKEIRFVDCSFEGNGQGAIQGLCDLMVDREEALLHASFSCPDFVRAGEEIRFRPEGSWTRERRTGLLWDLGDGPPRGEESPKHIYTRPGAYKVSLILWDEKGRPSLAERQVTVE